MSETRRTFYVPGLIYQLQQLRLEDTNLVIRSDLVRGVIGALEEQEALLCAAAREAAP